MCNGAISNNVIDSFISSYSAATATTIISSIFWRSQAKPLWKSLCSSKTLRLRLRASGTFRKTGSRPSFSSQKGVPPTGYAVVRHHFHTNPHSHNFFRPLNHGRQPPTTRERSNGFVHPNLGLTPLLDGYGHMM